MLAEIRMILTRFITYIPEFFGLQQTPREHLLPRQIHALTPARSKYSHPAKIFRKIRGLEIKKKTCEMTLRK